MFVAVNLKVSSLISNPAIFPLVAVILPVKSTLLAYNSPSLVTPKLSSTNKAQ